MQDWFGTSGARELRDTSILDYQEYLRRSEDCTLPHFEEDLRQIELDLPRTGESIRLFLLPQDDRETLLVDEELPQHVVEQFVPVLRRILVAYSVRNPRVGYVQGHADVLCFLLGNVNENRDEEEAFWVYAKSFQKTFSHGHPNFMGFKWWGIVEFLVKLLEINGVWWGVM
ncbi:Hypothetical protein PHPALM_6492 [Phytophthora palmivora]|uniref:Rab-GAP TBC domain-containing protein n=1 Tax=Phytophthora palmivora TaxID=4796 RepID=A0A2P4YF10_9STRA|nr:Hypothetical protein PHPALM_6492 [Phytophthora palmivora]